MTEKKSAKVLQINACYGFKSTGLIVEDIGKAAEKAGMETYYAYQQCLNSPKNGYLIGNKLDWKWHGLMTRIKGRQAYASKRATKKLLSWMDSINPDIVHLHNLHSNYIHLNVLCDYLNKNNIPTVITLHDCWYFTGKCTHYIAERCNRWQTTCGECPQLKKEVPSWFVDSTSFVLKDRISHLNSIKNLHIVGCSQWIAEEVKKSLLRPQTIRSIPNGVDLDVFQKRESSVREEYGLKNKFVIIGMANKWCSIENKEALEYIVNHLSEKDKIIIVGCSPEQQKTLQKFSNVIAIGYVQDRIKLAELYSVADVFVNLTHADTLPTVNMESIACGTPVITYDCCGSPELVLDGCGYIVPENDYIALVDKIKEVKSKSFPALQEARNEFDKNSNYKKYIELYNTVITNVGEL